MSKRIELTAGQARILREHHKNKVLAEQALGIALAAMLADEPSPVVVESYDVGEDAPHVMVKDKDAE